MRRLSVILLATAGACSSGEANDGSYFTSATLGGPTQPFDVDDADEEGEDDESSSGGKGGDETASSGGPVGDGTTSQGGSTSAGVPDGTSGGVEESSEAGGESTTGPFMPGNGQPDTGMYASCFDPELDNCTAFANVCLMIQSLNSGFCTHDVCESPADCNPAPLDATADPICIAGVSPEGMDTFLCALDCSAGRSCPAGMQCAENVSFGEDYPIYSFCI
jgi:hypothetical protein